MSRLSPAWRRKSRDIFSAFAAEMPRIPVSSAGELSSTSSVRSPKRSTMSAAVAGPMPFTARPAR